MESITAQIFQMPLKSVKSMLKQPRRLQKNSFWLTLSNCAFVSRGTYSTLTYFKVSDVLMEDGGLTPTHGIWPYAYGPKVVTNCTYYSTYGRHICTQVQIAMHSSSQVDIFVRNFWFISHPVRWPACKGGPEKYSFVGCPISLACLGL